MASRLKKIYQGKLPFSNLSFEVIENEISNFVLDVIIEAKTYHRFRARTGNLERSIKSNQKKVQNKIIVNFFLDDKIANYGKFVHEGFKSWKPDRFLENALDKYLPNLEKRINTKIRLFK